jgi:hypothetical protein
VLILFTALGILGESAAADDALLIDAKAEEITVRAEIAASDLATSVRALEGSLSAASAVPANGRALTSEEHDALVEAGMKAQLAGLADELDLLSASLAAGADAEMQGALLESVARRAQALSELGARPASVSIPPDLQARLIALWKDVEALRTGQAAAGSAPAPVEVTESENVP